MFSNNVFTKYQEISELAFFEKLGKNIKLYSNNGFQTANSLVQGGKVTDMFGGITTLSDIVGNPSVNGNNLSEKHKTQEIKVRAYWLSANDALRSIGYRGNGSVCKIICKSSDVVKLRSCDYAELYSNINSIVQAKIMMSVPPIPYGLGSNPQFMITYWEA